jgi:N-acetylglucosamine-6-phosphate deacetylase
MSEWVIDHARVLQPDQGVVADAIHLRAGKIVAVGSCASFSPGPQAQRIDAANRLLTPGLIDVHIHGIGSSRFEVADQLEHASRELTRFATTTAITTIIPHLDAQLLTRLERIAEAAINVSGANLRWLHLEGPFLKIGGAACPTIPGDLALLDDMIAACRGQMKVMSIAPDQINIIAVIERLVETNIVPFITHTRATAEQTQAAIDAGARHATHFYDVFPFPDETDPGVRPVGAVECVLANPRVSVDFVCDGVHVHPMAIRAALAAKGHHGVILITDANVGAGLADGIYDTPWGYPVKVTQNNATRIHDTKHPLNGALAGSALTMDRGIRNLMHWLDLPPEKIWAMATTNPARLLGLADKAILRPAADADVVLWNDNLTAAMTFVNGELVYQAQP